MVDLEFTVDGQKLIRNDTLLVANKSKNVISALFYFIDESDEIKIAIFSNIEKSYSKSLGPTVLSIPKFEQPIKS